MKYQDLEERTRQISEAALAIIENDGAEIGFVLMTIANGTDGHLIFSATNLNRNTALYVASQIDDVIKQDSSDSIGAVMGSA